MTNMSAGDKSLDKKTVARALLSATAIGSMFFLWAVFVNWGHGLEQAVRAGAGQGSVSFIISMSMAFMLEFLFFLPGIDKTLRIPFAVMVTMSVVIGASIMVHMLIGTPEIIKTIALPFIMGMSYTSLYCFRLSRMDPSAVMSEVGDN